MPRVQPGEFVAKIELSKKAKRAYQKSGPRYTLSASQIRAADRREELANRAKQLAKKEEKKKESKRKREEKEEKEREAKRLQLQEGKLRPEDTWGKVTASQPRLHGFFRKPQVTRKLRAVQESASEEQEEPDNKSPAICRVSQSNTSLSEDVSQEELERVFSSQASPSTQPTTPKHSPPHALVTSANISLKDSPHNEADSHKMNFPSEMVEAAQVEVNAQLSFELSQSVVDFDIAEDGTAEEEPQHSPSSVSTQNRSPPLSLLRVTNIQLTSSPTKRKADDEITFVSPAKSIRSALSEMSPAKVNIRAQEKPDMTSAPTLGAGLLSPEKQTTGSNQLAAETIAMIGTQDLAEDVLSDDKENADPRCEVRPNKDVASSKSLSTLKSPIKLKSMPQSGFGSFDDCEDLFDFDFEDDYTDEFEDGLDDETFLSIAATQKPKKDVLVDIRGSPKKLSPSRTIEKPAPITFNAMKMPPPPAKSKLATPNKKAVGPLHGKPAREPVSKSNSFNFDGVDDDELTDFADQLEADLEQSLPAAGTKKKRRLPWVVNPLPPPNTQDYLEAIADEELFDSFS